MRQGCRYQVAARASALGAPAPKSASTCATSSSRNWVIVARSVFAAVGKLAGGNVEPLQSALRDRGCTFEMGMRNRRGCTPS